MMLETWTLAVFSLMKSPCDLPVHSAFHLAARQRIQAATTATSPCTVMIADIAADRAGPGQLPPGRVDFLGAEVCLAIGRTFRS